VAIGLNERSNTCKDIISKNLRGFNEDKQEETILSLLSINKNLLPTLTPGISEF
jgi:hypothetical protein